MHYAHFREEKNQTKQPTACCLQLYKRCSSRGNSMTVRIEFLTIPGRMRTENVSVFFFLKQCALQELAVAKCIAIDQLINNVNVYYNFRLC